MLTRKLRFTNQDFIDCLVFYRREISYLCVIHHAVYIFCNEKKTIYFHFWAEYQWMGFYLSDFFDFLFYD